MLTLCDMLPTRRFDLTSENPSLKKLIRRCKGSDFQTPKRDLFKDDVQLEEEVDVPMTGMGQMQVQFRQMQEQMKMLTAGLETSRKAKKAEVKRAEDLERQLQVSELKLIAAESVARKMLVPEELAAAGSGGRVGKPEKRSVRKENSYYQAAPSRRMLVPEELAAAGSGRRVGKPEERSVRKEDYQAALKNLEKIKKDGSNHERWRKQFDRMVYVAKWNKKLFELDGVTVPGMVKKKKQTKILGKTVWLLSCVWSAALGRSWIT